MNRVWKLLGIAGLVGMVATGVVIARRRRAQNTYTPDELRDRCVGVEQLWGRAAMVLRERLVEEGHDVICLDNFFTSQKNNVAHLLDQPNFELIRHDVTLPIFLEVDEIYNLTSGTLARIADDNFPQANQENWLQTLPNRSAGIRNLISLAHRNSARLVQVSSDDLFGNSAAELQAANDIHHIDPFNVDIRTARIFNPYGPFMPALGGRVVSNFIVQALLNRPITIFGDGSQRRSFCYVDDLISGLRATMDAPHCIVGPMDLGSTHEYSVLELAQKIIALVGSSSSLEFQSPAQGHLRHRRPDVERAKHLLGWEPILSLEEGLIRTITYFEGMLHRNTAFAAALANNRFSFNGKTTGAREKAL